MASPLSSLVSNISSFPLLSCQFRTEAILDEDISLLPKKGIYPYDYIDSFERFKETWLPPKKSFDIKLGMWQITDEEYKRAKQVRKEFEIENMGEYYDLYLIIDVLLRADVFETFRDVCYDNDSYGLDPVHYYTSPVLAWSAVLKMTKQPLDLLSDVDMLLMIEKAKRRGISQVCSNRYAKANNKYLPDFSSDKATSYWLYFDANNLYGWAMSVSQLYGNFKWVKE